MPHFEIVNTLPSEATEVLESSLREFNRERNPEFWQARELLGNAASPLSVFARSNDNRVIGALTAETQFKWLRISLMSVLPDLRRQGIGAKIVQLAEQEAIRRGCTYAYVDTLDYQAPDFYKRLGYNQVGKLDDWDSHGHAKLFFVKRLAATLD